MEKWKVKKIYFSRVVCHELWWRWLWFWGNLKMKCWYTFYSFLCCCMWDEMHPQSLLSLAIKFVDRQTGRQLQMCHLHLRIGCCGVILCLFFAQEDDKNWNIVGAGQSNIFRYFWKNLSVCGTASWTWCPTGGRLGWKELTSRHQSNLKAKPEAKT